MLRDLVIKAMDSPFSVLAAIMRSRFEFPDRVKARSDVDLVVVKVDNRDRLVDEMTKRILGPSR